MELNGAVAVVTGASSGIGEATAVALARRGATVVLAARRLDRLELLAERIDAHGGRSAAVRCDVAEPEDVQALAALVLERFSRCDALINNAGIPGGGAFADLSFDQIERIVRVNQLGTMWTTKAFLPLMLRQGSGHVVNVASLAGRFAVPGAAVYSSTKHAVVAFSESLWHELRGRGVVVTAVNPGLVVTEGFPQEGIPARLTLPVDRVANTIVDVLRTGRGPEVSVPGWFSPLQLFRILTPGPYRWGVGFVTSRGARSGRMAR